MHPLIPCTERVIIPLGKLPIVPDFLNIHGFGIMVALGVWLGSVMAARKATRDGLDPNIISRVVGWIVVGIFVGGHLGHALFYEPLEYLRDPMKIFKVWDGLSSFGGFIACTILVLWVISDENRKVRNANLKRKEAGQPLQPLLPPAGYADSVMYGLTLGWLFGRFGCFLAHDHPGITSKFWLAVWGICAPQGEVLCTNVGVACHDLGLYESIWGGVMTLIVMALDKKPRPPGFFVAIYILVYGPTRFMLDFLRAHGGDARYFGLTPAQYGSLVLIGIGIWLLRWGHGKVPYRVANQASAPAP